MIFYTSWGINCWYSMFLCKIHRNGLLVFFNSGADYLVE